MTMTRIVLRLVPRFQPPEAATKIGTSTTMSKKRTVATTADCQEALRSGEAEGGRTGSPRTTVSPVVVVVVVAGPPQSHPSLGAQAVLPEGQPNPSHHPRGDEGGTRGAAHLLAVFLAFLILLLLVLVLVKCAVRWAGGGNASWYYFFLLLLASHDRRRWSSNLFLNPILSFPERGCSGVLDRRYGTTVVECKSRREGYVRTATHS